MLPPLITEPSAELVSRVAELRQRRPVSWRAAHGGYSVAERWLVLFHDGSSAFVKTGTTPVTSSFIRREAAMYQAVHAPFMPTFLGWKDHETSPLLMLEDLADAHWPPPWPTGSTDRVLRMLDDVHAVRTGLKLPRASETLDAAIALTADDGIARGSRVPPGCWAEVAANPVPFLSLGLCSKAWLRAAIPDLVAAEKGAIIDGDSLLHADVRSDNICLTGDRTLLVDWNWACVGDPTFDVAFWLPSLHSEGGPAPHDILPHEPEYAALVSGFFASRAGLPPPQGAPMVRQVQLAQLRAALPWAIQSIGLPALNPCEG